MGYKVNFSTEFQIWFAEQEERLQDTLSEQIKNLERKGPHLGRPLVDTLKGSQMSNLKEFRLPFQGQPYRILFAFDPEREAILLIGGNKASDKKWYQRMIPQAETIFANHLKKLAEKS